MSQNKLNLLGATLDSSTNIVDFSKFGKIKISTSNDPDAAVRNDSVTSKITTAINNATPLINNPSLSGTVTLSSLTNPGILHTDSNGVITSSKIKSNEIDNAAILYSHLDTTITNAFAKTITTSSSAPLSTSGTLGDIILTTTILYICTSSAVNNIGAVWKTIQLSSL